MPKILSVLDSINVSADYVRPVREGKEVLNAGLVISVGIKRRQPRRRRPRRAPRREAQRRPTGFEGWNS